MELKYKIEFLWYKICDKFLYKHFKGIAWYDLPENISDYRMEKGKYVIRCKKCGQLLAPFIDFLGPCNCGWHLVKENHEKYYICHQCYDHGLTLEDPWWKNEVKRRNKETIAKLKRYKHNHPWVKIRRDYL